MNLKNALLDLLFPPKCPFCGRILEEDEDMLCARCQRALPWLTEKAAERKVEFADGCFSPLAYRDRARDGVRRYKFRRCLSCAQPFASLMAQCVRDHLREEADAVTWAPLSRFRRWRRGFDQAELLARALGRELGLPVVPALRKVRSTVPQSSLTDPARRRANARGAYRLLPGWQGAGMRLLLVDDVVTSGATLSECAFLLRQAGAEKVWCVTLAQAGRGKEKEKARKN